MEINVPVVQEAVQVASGEEAYAKAKGNLPRGRLGLYI